MERIKLPRVMIAAPASGTGKTMITCGLLKALKKRRQTIAFKCGPDYIDPMFHKAVLGIPSRNLDTFFADTQTVRFLMARAAIHSQAEIAVVEGVMGFYDGVAGTSTMASSYDLAVQTETPVVLVVNCKGRSLSLLAEIEGFMHFEKDVPIKGIILNRLSEMMYPRMKAMIEERLCVKVLGYVPETKAIDMPGRHLGLMMPQELGALENQLDAFSETLEETIDMDALMALANEAPELTFEQRKPNPAGPMIRIGLAQDEAFCFYYEDNLDLLRELGAELIPFSPVHDKVLPEGLQGIYMGGGYPELHAKTLSENVSMRASLRQAIEKGMPVLAECGAFMYLHDRMEDDQGVKHEMVGAISGEAENKGKLVRFGYTHLTLNEDCLIGKKGMTLPAHEFHYWDTTSQGSVCHAQKPLMKRSWDCMVRNEKGNLLAGFPHLYFYGNETAAENFIERCRKYKNM